MSSSVREPRLVDDLNVEIMDKLKWHMDPVRLRHGLRELSGYMGLTAGEMETICNMPGCSRTELVLQHWKRKKKNPTVSELIRLLKKIQQPKVAALLKDHEFVDISEAVQESSVDTGYNKLSQKTPCENIDTHDLAIASNSTPEIGVTNGMTVFEFAARNPNNHSGADILPTQYPPDPVAAACSSHVTSVEQNVVHVQTAVPGDKIALVIGNQSYKTRKLYHALKDASDIAIALRSLGFKVLCLFDLTREEMRMFMLAFVRLIDEGVFAVFYYSGHGFESGGENYLIPVDCDDYSDRTKSIRAQEILVEMQLANSMFNLLIIDTCRVEMPASAPEHALDVKVKRYADKGGNTIIAHSCSWIAFEVRQHDNGIYARELLRRIRRNDRIENILIDINAAVSMNGIVRQNPTFQTDACFDCRLTTPAYEQPSAYAPRRLIWASEDNESELEDREMDGDVFMTQVTFGRQTGDNVVMFDVTLVKMLGVKVTNISVATSVCKPLETVIFPTLNHMLPDFEPHVIAHCAVMGLQKLEGTLLIVIDIKFDADNEESHEIHKIDLGKPKVAKIIDNLPLWLSETSV